MAQQLSTRDFNQSLANTIINFWERRGFRVEVDVLPMKATAQGEAETVLGYVGWQLKSDMVNGWPREYFERRNAGRLRAA